MNLPAVILGAGGSFLLLCLVFHPLERAFPAKPGQKFFRPEWGTDLCFFIGQYLLWSGLVLWVLSRFADGLDGGALADFRAAVAGQPWWLQAVEVILLSDFLVYWGHRLQHRIPFLWRFHSNVRLNIGPLRWFIGAPELHHWHHDRARDAGNYANISPLMDLAFGTYRCPDHEPESFGIHEEIPRSYFGQLLHPFRRRRARK